MNQPALKKETATKKRSRPKFETAKCITQMRSQHYHTVVNGRVTPPEFILMQQVHGKDAVRFIEKTGYAIETRLSENGERQQRFMPRSELIDRLRLRYTPKVFEKAFPGNDPNLPFTFEDIGVTEDVLEYYEDDDGWEAMPNENVPAPVENIQDQTGSEGDGLDDFDLDDDDDETESEPEKNKNQSGGNKSNKKKK